MTPAQADGALQIASRILRQERAMDLNTTAMAFRNDGKELTRRINKDLADD
jgi:hypothetical protein